MRAAKVAVVALMCGSLLVTPPASAHPARGNLPGGTSIEVSIDRPADGSVLPPGPVAVSGTAAIGQSTPRPDTGLVIVLDVSSSTLNLCDQPTVPVLNFAGRAQEAPTILDCEKEAARLLNQEAAKVGTVGKVGAVAFADGVVVADARPGTAQEAITDPGPEMDVVLASAFAVSDVEFAARGFEQHTRKDIPADGTDMIDGLRGAVSVVDALQAAQLPKQTVVFVSDGQAEVSDALRAAARAVPQSAKVHTFAVGNGSACRDSTGDRALQVIADEARGSCTKVTNPADLKNALPEVIASKLTGLELVVDDGEPVPITGVTPALPVTGPASVTYRTTTPALAAGTHTVCVRAIGSDGGGTGAVADCHEIVVNTPPTVTAGGPYSGLEDTAIPIEGAVTDPDTTSVATTWTSTPGCVFADPAALRTTVTCAERGTYTLTLTADDRLNPPVSASTTLTVTNGAPVVETGGPYTGQENTGIQLTGKVTDPDGPALTTRWSSEPDCAFGNAAQLSTVVTCLGVGTFTLTLVADDGVNPPVTATTTIVTTKAPPERGPLTLTTSDSAGFVGGDDVIVTYRVRNGSLSVMTDVRLTTTSSLTPKSGACPCVLGSLQPNQTVEVKLAFPAAAADATVSGTVTTTGPDSDPADNTAVARVVVKQPTLTLEQNTANLGTVIRVQGKDFPAGAKVKLAWSAGLSETPGEFVAAANGQIDAQMLLFHRDQRGVRLVLATHVEGTRFGEVKSPEFFALPRTVQPPGFISRG